MCAARSPFEAELSLPLLSRHVAMGNDSPVEVISTAMDLPRRLEPHLRPDSAFVALGPV